MKPIEPPIIIFHTYPTTTNRLWSALTDLHEMREWYFEALPDFKPEIGFKTSFLLENEGRKFTHQFEVLAVEPEKMIRYTFNFAEYDGDGHVTFEIEPDGNQTTLTLTSVVTKAYPSDIPEFKRESGIGGWNYFLKQRLTEYLASN